MTRCRAYAGVVMLWWAVDESYQHALGSGHAVRVTLAGAVATCPEWLGLESQWQHELLRPFKIPEFHMTDFEANRGIFAGWDQAPERRRDLLATALDIIQGNGLKHFFGVTREVADERGNETEAYRLCVDDLIVELARYKSHQLNDQFAIMFARRQGFRPDLARQAIEREGAEKFGPIISDRPVNVCALQVADLIAYETRCIQRNRPERYPFGRLREIAARSGGSFSLTAR